MNDSLMTAMIYLSVGMVYVLAGGLCWLALRSASVPERRPMPVVVRARDRI